MGIFEGQGLYSTPDGTMWVDKRCLRKIDYAYAVKVGLAETFFKEHAKQEQRKIELQRENPIQVDDVQEAWEAGDIHRDSMDNKL